MLDEDLDHGLAQLGSRRWCIVAKYKCIVVTRLPSAQCTVLYCTVEVYSCHQAAQGPLYCTVLYCTVLYCTILYCTVLYCIRLTQRVVQRPGPVCWSARLPLLVREAQGGVIPVALSVDRQVDI